MTEETARLLLDELHTLNKSLEKIAQMMAEAREDDRQQKIEECKKRQLEIEWNRIRNEYAYAAIATGGVYEKR